MSCNQIINNHSHGMVYSMTFFRRIKATCLSTFKAAILLILSSCNRISAIFSIPMFWPVHCSEVSNSPVPCRWGKDMQRDYTKSQPRVKTNGGLGVRPIGAVVDSLWKRSKTGMGLILDNHQLNNSLAHSNFRYFTFSGRNIKTRPPGKVWPSLEKSLDTK